jgi:threonine synthase
LPVKNKDNIYSLGEGDTPLLHLKKTGCEKNLPYLFIKDEGFNPTGSFKARGMSVAVSKAIELGIKNMVIPTAGNAGGALAAYTALAGIHTKIYMPKSSPVSNIEECKVTGAEVILTDGTISEAGKLASENEIKYGWFNASTFKEPYRLEGKKINGYEIAEYLDWKLPDVILYPTGGGTGLVGMWKSFLEMERLGWLESSKMPRMISVQSEGCAPIVKAFQEGRMSCEKWENANTIATGLCVPLSFADKLILRNINESDGMAISVSDSEILEARNKLATTEGIFTCPEGAATYAALLKLEMDDLIKPDEKIVIFNTASGLKYL